MKPEEREVLGRYQFWKEQDENLIVSNSCKVILYSTCNVCGCSTGCSCSTGCGGGSGPGCGCSPR